MSVAVDQQTLKDMRISDRGRAQREKRRLATAQRKLDAMKKVSKKLVDGLKLTPSSLAVVIGIAPQGRKPAAKKVKQPAKQPVSDVKIPKPKPAKVKAKKATPHKPARTDRVAELVAMPERSLFSTSPIGKTYPLHDQQLGPWSEQDKQVDLLARKMIHDRYLNSQDEREIQVMVHDNRASAKSVLKGKKPMTLRIRSNAMNLTLERLAVFKSVCVLRDDYNHYEVRSILTRNNIKVGGVRFTFGFKRERVLVPLNGITQAEYHAKLARFESLKSRGVGYIDAPTQPDVGVVTADLEDPPPWLLTVVDAVARGYGSIEEEFDAPRITAEQQRINLETFKYIPHGINLFEIMKDAIAQEKRNDYMHGLASLPVTGPPFYSHRSDNDEPSPTTPAPAVASLPVSEDIQENGGYYHYATGLWMEEDEVDIDMELKREFQRQEDEANVPERIRDLRWFLFAKRDFRRQYRHEDRVKFDHYMVQCALGRKEQTYPSDPRNEGDRYYEWLSSVETDDDATITREELQIYLGHAKQQREYDDMFGVINLSASYRRHKAPPRQVPMSRWLPAPEKGNDQDPPSTGAAPVCDGPIKVGYSFPNFLIAEDGIVIPFRRGVNTTVGVATPSKVLALVPHQASLFEWETTSVTG